MKLFWIVPDVRWFTPPWNGKQTAQTRSALLKCITSSRYTHKRNFIHSLTKAPTYPCRISGNSKPKTVLCADLLHSISLRVFCVFCGASTLFRDMSSRYGASQSRSLYTPNWVRLLWTSDQSVAETSTWQHTTLKTDIHAPAGLEPTIPSKRTTANPRLRPRGNRDRQFHLNKTKRISEAQIYISLRLWQKHVSTLGVHFTS